MKKVMKKICISLVVFTCLPLITLLAYWTGFYVYWYLKVFYLSITLFGAKNFVGI